MELTAVEIVFVTLLLNWCRIHQRACQCCATQGSEWIWNDNAWIWPCVYSVRARK